jgi:transcriptional regulator with XRE-family HTH domain
MAISERIRYFRKKRRMTQKQLGIQAGLSPVTAEVRIAQYETLGRSPRPELTETLASVLNVSPFALTVPDIDTELGLLHTLFALEDIYGLTVSKEDGVLCLVADVHKNPKARDILALLDSWQEISTLRRMGDISQEEYDQWRYCFPAYETFEERKKRKEAVAARRAQNNTVG